ncbi:hypothetical protein JCM8202_002205 [Rhodotorula sphaerocarpa]
MQHLCTAPAPGHGEAARDAGVASTMRGADAAEAGGSCATVHGDTIEASTDAARVSENACGAERDPKPKKRASRRRWETDEIKEAVLEEEAFQAEQARNAMFTYELLLKLPLEMLAEICSFLDLPDLVSLAKVSPELNKIMLSSGANHIWRASRERSGYKMPADCSSELRFASILETRFPSYSGVSRFFSRTQTIRRLAEEDRVFAAREIAAAHADVDLRLACKDPDAYPLKKYGPAFFSALPNRYNVWAGSFIKLREAMDATGGSIQDLSRVNSPAWRRAVAHVLAVRGLPKDVKASPEKLDALGATFRWVNGPRYHKGHPKTWRAMASLFAL